MVGPSSLGSPNFILGCDPPCSFEREEGGHTPFQNHSVRFRWLFQVVWVHLLISLWGVTPPPHPFPFQKLQREKLSMKPFKDFAPLAVFRRRSLSKVCSCSFSRRAPAKRRGRRRKLFGSKNKWEDCRERGEIRENRLLAFPFLPSYFCSGWAAVWALRRRGRGLNLYCRLFMCVCLAHMGVG